MAGGPNAQIVACMTCLFAGDARPATRTREGLETDWYRCEAGHECGVDWAAGAPSEPQWPPSAETLAALAQIRARGHAG